MTKRFAMPTLAVCLGIWIGVAAAQEPGLPESRPVPASPSPLRLLARFLQLSEEQVDGLRSLLEDRRAALEAVNLELDHKTEAWKELINAPTKDPLAIGNLAIEIHELRSQITEAHRIFRERFEALLSEEQVRKLRLLLRALEWEPVLRALRELKLG